MHLAPIRTPTPTLAAYAEHWLQAIRGTVAPQTWRGYRTVVRAIRASACGDVPLADLRAAHLREWLAALQLAGKAPQTAARFHAVVTIILNVAVTDDLLVTNVGRGLARKLHRPVRPRTSLDLAELEDFLALAERETPRFYPLIVALVAGGLRIGEAIALRAEDIHPTEPLIHVRRSIRSGGIQGPTKSKRTREVVVTPMAAAILRNVTPSPAGWLFPGRSDAPVSAETIRKIVRVLADAAGIVASVSPKTFRRSYAAVMKRAGIDTAFIGEQFGHQDQRTTERYYLYGTRRGPIPMMLNPAHLRRRALA